MNDIQEIEIDVYIACYTRHLYITVSWEQAEEAAAIAYSRYDTWVENELPEVEDACCEEYILQGLADAGIQYRHTYGDSEEE